MMPILRSRAGIPRFASLLRDGTAATAVAFGTSLTLGAMHLMPLLPALRAAFPNERCTWINRGRNGYNTLAGVFRLVDDVLPNLPDLVVVEFAHNDVTDALVSFVDASLEGMIAQVRRVSPACEFVFVNFALPGFAAAGPTPAMRAYEDVAERHGIPSIDMATFIEELVASGRATFRGDDDRALTVDGVHHSPGAVQLLGIPFATPVPTAVPALRSDALMVVSRTRAADLLSTGAWNVRPVTAAEIRGAGIDEEGLAEALEVGASLRLAFTGTNAFVWMSGNGALGVRISETGEQFRVAVDARAKWTWCSLMETHPAAHYTLEIFALDAGLLFGDLGIAGTLG
jgi:lysophospholipase L1-like esterase